MTITEIRKMSSILERLQIMEELCDPLSYEENEIEIESPEWHEILLESRRKKIKTGRGKS